MPTASDTDHQTSTSHRIIAILKSSTTPVHTREIQSRLGVNNDELACATAYLAGQGAITWADSGGWKLSKFAPSDIHG
jgi:hypothetical protein